MDAEAAAWLIRLDRGLSESERSGIDIWLASGFEDDGWAPSRVAGVEPVERVLRGAVVARTGPVI
jgi:hypothetical protein